MTGIEAERLTPNQIAQRLLDLSRMLDAAQRELAIADEQAVRARSRFLAANATSFLGGSGSVDARKQQAVLACSSEHLDVELADLAVRTLRTRLAVLRDQVEITRSLGAGMRSEWAATV